jgi:hypothetical protein
VKYEFQPQFHPEASKLFKGFKTTQHSAIELQVADQKYVDTTLDVGAVSETVVVNAVTPLLDTTAAVSGTVITQQQLETIPSYTNSPIALAALAPGVTNGLPSGGAAHLWSNTSESELVSNESGSGANAINYQIDGGSNTWGTATWPSFRRWIRWGSSASRATRMTPRSSDRRLPPST